MANKIQIRRGLKEKLPLLSPGEFGFASDTSEVFIGNGENNVLVAGDMSGKLDCPPNALYVYCDGDNDAAKINAALGENAAESAEKRIVYLVGECVLNASHLIADESDATKAYVIRPCANVVFDGTYCTSLTWDGSVEVDNSVQYRMFCFTAGQCGFQNMHIKYVNFDNTWYDPIFVRYENTEDKGLFIMRDMIIEDMQSPVGRYLIFIADALRSLVENVTFKRLAVKNQSISVQCMVLGSCDFINNKLYDLKSNVGFKAKFITLSKNSRVENNYFENAETTAPLNINISSNSTFSNNMFLNCVAAPTVSFQGGCVIQGNNYRNCTVRDYVFSSYGSNVLATVKDNMLVGITLGKTAVGVINVSYGTFENNRIQIRAIEDGASLDGVMMAEIYCDMNYTNIIGNTIMFSTSLTLPENYAAFYVSTEFDTGAFMEKNYTNTPVLMNTSGDGNVVCKDNIITGAAQAE